MEKLLSQKPDYYFDNLGDVEKVIDIILDI